MRKKITLESWYAKLGVLIEFIKLNRIDPNPALHTAASKQKG